MRKKLACFVSCLLLILYSITGLGSEKQSNQKSATHKNAETCSEEINFGLEETDGLGHGEPGRFDIEIEIISYKRHSLKANDGGEKSTYCYEADVPASECSKTWRFDGIYLVPEARTIEELQTICSGLPIANFDMVWSNPNMNFSTRIGAIEGPFQKMDRQKQWEWPDKGYTTYRPTTILRVRYDALKWSGRKSDLESKIRIRWYEWDNEGYPFVSHDYSCYYIFELGELIWTSLKLGSNSWEWREIIKQSDDKSFVIRSDNPKHYAIQIWYEIRARWKRIESSGISSMQ